MLHKVRLLELENYFLVYLVLSDYYVAVSFVALSNRTPDYYVVVSCVALSNPLAGFDVRLHFHASPSFWGS
jgi:hypothetical protein